MNILKQASQAHGDTGSVIEWANERISVADGEAHLYVLSAFGDYARWCEAGGMRPLSLSMFARTVMAQGVERRRDSRARYYVGIALKEPQVADVF
jgi:hypothetical protein